MENQVLTVKITQPRNPGEKWDVLEPATVLTDKEISELRTHMKDGKFGIMPDVQKIFPAKLLDFAKEKNIEPIYLAEAIANNPIFNNVAIYDKGIPAPTPDDTVRTIKLSSNSQDIWRYFYQKYNIPIEIQQQLFDQGVSLQVSRLGEANFQYTETDRSYISGNVSRLANASIEDLMPDISHEVAHWYYERLPEDQKQTVRQYFVDHPEYSDTIKASGQLYKTGMDADAIAREGYASSLFPGASSYGLLPKETQVISRDLAPLRLKDVTANNYHTYSFEDIQADIEKQDAAIAGVNYDHK
jgi:hypothetical protein